MKPKGQLLITLIFFTVIAMTIITAAIFMIFINRSSTTKLELGSVARSAAESGAENALLRLLRNPNYTGETLIVGEGSTITTVTGSNPKTITAVSTVGDFVRKVQIVVTYTNNILSVTSWKEI